MKIRLLFSLALLSFCNLGFGQVMHTDLSPDSVLDITIGSFKFMKMDIDGDQSDDVEFVSTNYPSFGLWNLGVQQLDTLNPKVEILIDGSVSPSPIGDHYVKMLSAGDVIDASGTYSSDYPQVGDIYNPNFLGQGLHYIGFRIISGSDYKYGWFAAELSGTGDMTFTIQEMAYDNTPNTSINAASGSLSLTDISIEPVVDIYPNPSANGFEISCKDECNIEEIKVYRLDGRLVFESGSPSLPLKLSTDSWESGSFIIQIRKADGLQVSRWVKY